MIKDLRKKFMLVLFTMLTTFIFTGCGYTYIVDNARVLDKEDAKEFTIEKTAVDLIKGIDIHTRIANVQLIPSDKYYVEINYLYWEDAPEYSLENGVLRFDDADSFPNSYSIRFNLNNYIKIYLPADAALDKINVEDAAGDIDASGFTTDDLNLSVSYGDLTLDNVTALDSDITLSSGSSSIKDFNASKMKYSNSYGNAKFTNINNSSVTLPDSKTFDNFNASLSSGEINIKGLNSSSIDISNSYGNVTCEEVTGDKLSASLSSGDFDVSKSDIKDISVSDSYGDVTLNVNGTTEDYRFDLSTSYGDINVDGKSYDDHVVLDHGGDRSIDADLSSGDIDINLSK